MQDTIASSCRCLVIFVSAVLLTLSPARAAGKFVSASSRVDIAYDDSRGLLYITNGDEMLRYQLSSQSFQTPVTISGSTLMGLDI